MKRKITAIILTVVLVLALAVPMAAVGASPGPGIVGLWHFDGDANDSTTNNNDGSLQGDPEYVSGMFDEALSLDGNGDYVSVPDVTTLQLTSDMTVEAWVYISAFDSDWVRVVGKGNSTNRNYGLWYHGSSGNVLFQIYSGTGSKANTGTIWGTVENALTVSVGQWYHFAGVKDGNTIYLYLNGVLVASAPITFTPATSADPLTVGYAGFHTAHNGLIDEVRIWDTASPEYTLTATPEEAFNPVGTTHTVTATVTPNVAGVPVVFNIDGPDTDQDATVYTDASGEAELTIDNDDNGAGVDDITVSFPDGYAEAPVTGPGEVTLEKYWLENFLTGGGIIKDGKKVAGTFAGTVGVIEGEGIVGQFQIVDHTGKKAEAWHCNNDFTYLNFGGPPTGSPPASHSIAVFTGTFTSNRGSPDWTVTIIIQDVGEPGAGVDIIKFGGLPPYAIDGGNFQVHDIVED